MNDPRTHLLNLARVCLAKRGLIDVLKIRQFRDDCEAHDDSLQQHIETEFRSAFSETVAVLEVEFGAARVAEDEADGIPLDGVFRSAIWRISDQTLFVAAAHEDRELPYMLMIGSKA